MASFESGSTVRTIVVGDVHGCRAELESLLTAVRFAQGSDRLIFVGDVIARGPDSHGVLAAIERFGATVVRGNHEDKILSARNGIVDLKGEHQRLAATLSEAEWRILEAMPLWLDVPEHGARIVHAGVVPGRKISSTPRDALLRIRSAEANGRWTDDKNASPLWGELYVGPPHVVFGHNALTDPQLHDWATGIDTGCVYGGRLTAIVLDAGEPMPRGRKARTKLTSVKARERYFPG
ncbi:MAG: metallophosphoesterase [Polyangiaceae bacterium]|jgi:hypothetical protein